MADASRLEWRCRRGVRELDLIFRRFLDGPWASLAQDERLAFERLLDEADADILAWILQQQPMKAEYAGLIDVLRRGFQHPDRD